MKALPLLLLAIAVAGHAQEVTVTPPVWLREDTPPEQLPVRRHSTLPSYPREARKSGEIGYVLLENHVNPDGKVFRYFTGASQVALERAVQDDPWITEMKPALQGGKPAEADIWYAFIFNPESATAAGPDRTPRLLTLTPIWVPGKALAGYRGHSEFRARLKVDEKGAVSGVEMESPADAGFLPAIQEATARWTFAPALRNGRAVAATVSLPLVLSAKPPVAVAKGEYVPAHVLKRVPPFYPFALRRLHLRASVEVGFTVDIHGEVQDARVQSSTNPVFEEEALNAIRKWKFSPAMKDGKPVASHMVQHIVFQFFRDNHDLYQVIGNQSGLPPEYRYDTAPVIRGFIEPAYPYEELQHMHEGSATVVVLIDANGRVAHTQVAAASTPSFGAAAAAALEMYQFDPAMRDGKATPTLLKQELHFHLRMDAPDALGENVYTDYALLRSIQKNPGRVVSARKLDHPLHPTSQRAPVFPANLVGQTDHGTALIEIVIDKDGHARIPRILASSDPAFGYAAAQAVVFWRFDAPKVGGKSVLTKAAIPFEFGSRKS